MVAVVTQVVGYLTRSEEVKVTVKVEDVGAAEGDTGAAEEDEVTSLRKYLRKNKYQAEGYNLLNCHLKY